ncbi:UbiA family prenyltransferase [Candidatus Daviesbacteria bacterium]|nr:UbiA family prenyltransferase [Candidatus Daviesbacteria bacterium]
MGKLKLLLLTSRPVFWSVYFFICLLGIVTSGIWNVNAFLSLFYVTMPLGITIFSINDIADRKSDINNPRKGGWQGNILKKSDIPFLLWSVSIITISFAVTFFLLNNFLAAILILIVPLLAYAYSFKPLRLKGRPFLDSLINAVGMLLVYLLGFSQKGQIDIFKLPLIVWIIFLGFIAAHALSTLADYEVDKNLDYNTTSVFLGRRLTAVYCAAILIILSLVVPFHLIILAYLLICIGFCLTLLGNPGKKFILKGSWFLIFGFCLMSAYLFIFDYQFILKITTN